MKLRDAEFDEYIRAYAATTKTEDGELLLPEDKVYYLVLP
jgi:hypothetical protein